MGSLIIAVVLGLVYVRYRNRDRRLLRNGVFLLGAIWFVLLGAVSLLSQALPGFGLLPLAVLALAPLAVVVLAVFLIANGITMIRTERVSLGHLLSLLAGFALLIAPALGVLLVITIDPLAVGIAAVLFFVTGYLGVAFLVFLVWSIVYRRTALTRPPAALVVLGSKIIDGQVPPLLANRLDRALDLYREGCRVGVIPLLVPSGGQGEDESRSEGEAMAEYLVAHGADPADVVPETRARNTRENLQLSAAVQQGTGRVGTAVAVTNDYHVLRAAMLARSLGTDTQVVGAPTARYYVPSAFLREFVAVLVEHKIVSLLLCLPFFAATVIFVLALYAIR